MTESTKNKMRSEKEIRGALEKIQNSPFNEMFEDSIQIRSLKWVLGEVE